MAFNAKVYSESNSIQDIDGNDLIDSFLRQNNGKFFDIIVDIGCGTGNVTKVLSQKIPHNKILAFDIDSGMTESAKNNFGSDSIEYLTEDISKPWDQLIPELKALESKVSLIFSNRVLHWVEDKETSVKNINKLLKVNGNICIQITGLLEVIPQLRLELKQKFVTFPTVEEQYEIWKTLFTNEGLVLTHNHCDRQNRFYERKIIISLRPVIPKSLEIYVKSKSPEEREKVINDPEFVQFSLDFWSTEFNQDFVSDNYSKFVNSNKEGLNLNNIQFRFVGIKLQSV